MEPLGIATCVVTLGEVSIKTLRILQLIGDPPAVSERTSQLARDIENLRVIDAAVRSFLFSAHRRELRVAIIAILDECDQVLGNLESLLRPCVELQSRGALRRSQALWITKSRRIDKLEERLRELIASLSLCLSAYLMYVSHTLCLQVLQSS